MAFSAKQLTSTTINSGVKYVEGDALTHTTINALVEGILYATDNSGVTNAIATANSAVATAKSASRDASSALTQAQAASKNADSAASIANSAILTADAALSKSNSSIQNSEDALNFAENALSKAEGCVRKLGDTMRGDLIVEHEDGGNLYWTTVSKYGIEIVDDNDFYNTKYYNGCIYNEGHNSGQEYKAIIKLPTSDGTLVLEDFVNGWVQELRAEIATVEDDVPRRAQISIAYNNYRDPNDTIDAELVINTVLSRREANDIVDGQSLFQFFRNCGWTSELNGIDAHGIVNSEKDGTHNAGGILWLSDDSIYFFEVHSNLEYDFDGQMVTRVSVKFN